MMKIACAVDEIRSLTPDQAKAILDKDKKGEYLLIDVRQPEEYETGHIPGWLPRVYNVLGSVKVWVAAGFPVITD